MPSAALLRKTLLAILQEKILPGLMGESTPCIVLARLPLDVPANVGVREISTPPLKETDARRSPAAGQVWDEAQMYAMDIPTLLHVVEGESERKIAVTEKMLLQARQRRGDVDYSGGYIFSLPASSYFLIPPYVPQSIGNVPSWHRDEPYAGQLIQFAVRILPVGALCNMSILKDGELEVSYSLFIEDDQLAVITGVLINEQSTPRVNPQIVKAQLLSLMLRLERGMSTQIPPMTDGLYSRFPGSQPVNVVDQPLEHPLVQKVHAYIQLHLHKSLTPSDIAAHVRLTPAQVNRVLRNQTGMSIMGYVTRQRVEVAQRLLRTSEQSVEEIAHLVGFERASHFSRTFRRHVGLSPLKFRQQQDFSFSKP